jgi:hypothetical protein
MVDLGKLFLLLSMFIVRVHSVRLVFGLVVGLNAERISRDSSSGTHILADCTSNNFRAISFRFGNRIAQNFVF